MKLSIRISLFGRVLAAVITAMAISACSTCGSQVSSSVEETFAEGESMSPAGQRIFDRCSMIALLATPERYHGRWIQVVGYARVGFEFQFLFPLEEYYQKRIPYSAVWLAFDDATIDIEDPEVFDGSYVLVEGVFDANQFGHGALGRGTIKQISRIQKRANGSANGKTSADPPGQ